MGALPAASLGYDKDAKDAGPPEARGADELTAMPDGGCESGGLVPDAAGGDAPAVDSLAAARELQSRVEDLQRRLHTAEEAVRCGEKAQSRERRRAKAAERAAQQADRGARDL